MDVMLQAKLLRVIQERKVRPVGGNQIREIDVRIVAATHKDLKSAIKDGKFREDLFYRLGVIPLVLPPLRHRREDIPILSEHFLKKYAAMNASKVKGFTKRAMSRLVGMHWEGNVRELENIVERSVVLASGELIDETDLPVQDVRSVEEVFAEVAQGLPTLEVLEKRYIRLVLDQTHDKKDKAAQILGINRRTLYRKEREYGFVTSTSEDEEFNRDQNQGQSLK
jgi:transcriptional regulator with PAS, ATPase and Fis domain